MKSTLKKIIIMFLFLLCLFPIGISAATYTVPANQSIVDGDTFCGGRACTPADTIIIEAGTRGSLKLKDFNGRGSYITITNEDNDANKRVIITQNEDGWPLVLENCHYVDLRGDGEDNGDFIKDCGIKSIHNSNMKGPAALNITGSGSNIKVSYLELTNIGTGISGCGIKVGLNGEGELLLYDTLEIHHNYIHDVKYAGMYIGLDDGPGKPYLDNVKIHNNLLENMGAYGITLKRIHASSKTASEIYNNTVRHTALITDKSGLFKQGIGVTYFFGSYAKIYNNTIEDTGGAGIKIARGDGHQVFNNILIDSGTHDEIFYGHGISVMTSAKNSHIYDNKIIRPKRYGVYVQGSAGINNMISGNIIIDAGLGEWYASSAADIIVSDIPPNSLRMVKGVCISSKD